MGGAAGKKQLSVEDLAKKTLDIVRRSGSNGIPQKELISKLGLEPKEGLRLIRKLIKKGLVIRDKVVVDGKSVYMLFSPEYRSYDSTVSLETAIRIPCFTCPFFKECGVGGSWSPLNCPYMEKWLEEEYSKSKRRDNV